MEKNVENNSVENTDTVNETKNGFQENGNYRLDLTSINTEKSVETAEETVTEEPTSEVTEEATETEATVEQPEGEEFVALTEITDEPETETQEIEDEPEVVSGTETTTEEVTSEMPEELQKLWSFMQETGGNFEDYVKLNQDYDKLNETQLLREYYESTRSYLDKEDIDLLLEDFSYDEELDDDRDIRKKKIAYKEELKKAKDYLGDLKEKYYTELKQGSRLTPEAKEALVYKQEREEAQRIAEAQLKVFLNRTEKVFSKDFKGFDFSVGEKKYRFNVNNVDDVKSAQSNLNNFIGRFLDDKGEIADAGGYHKALFTAMNADRIAQHFYNQGRADQVKESGSSRKNIDMDPNEVHTDKPQIKGVTFKVL